MKKTFLNILPRGSGNIGKFKIDWEKCADYEVPFVYNNIKGKIKIIDCFRKNNRTYLKIKYKDNVDEINTDGLIRCQLGDILGLKTSKYKYSVGDIITDVTSGNLQILEQIRMKNGKNTEKGYRYKCLICGNEDIITEGSLKQHMGCNVCSGHKIKIGYNDMWTTNPKLASLLADPNDGYKYTQNSGKKVNFKCLDCDNIIENKIISNVKQQGISCPKCGDGVSYPEKIMYNVLQQLLEENFEYQYSPNWCKYKLNNKNKTGRYDFYFKLNDKQYIIEMDGGLGHGNDIHKKSKLTKKETLEIDNIKDELADNHNIEVIRIDCFYSNNNKFEYIKNHILKSKLKELFNLSKINWLICEKYSCSNFIKKVCNLWNKNIYTVKELSKITKIGRTTIYKYLKQGAKLGWCDYDPKKEMRKKKNQKKVICLNNKKVFNSLFEAGEFINRSYTGISKCCNKQIKHCGKDLTTNEPLKWMYYNKYLNLNNNIIVQ